MQPQAYEACTLCPRCCGVNRSIGQRGFCRAGAQPKVARAALHHWEEPCISGTKGSGTVFFSHCTLACTYCQNREISYRAKGQLASVLDLTEIFLRLEQQGAHNLNLVTPTHYLPSILEALDAAKVAGFHLPVVYNCGGYERPETIRQLKGYVDIFLPDWKYADPQLAAQYSAAPDYPQIALAAIEEMIELAGPPVFDESGLLKQGVLVRHLVLPDARKQSKVILDEFARHFSGRALFSLMSQYTPTVETQLLPSLNRPLKPLEYKILLSHAQKLGIDGFSQDPCACGKEYIPAFDGEGLPNKEGTPSEQPAE